MSPKQGMKIHGILKESFDAGLEAKFTGCPHSSCQEVSEASSGATWLAGARAAMPWKSQRYFSISLLCPDATAMPDIFSKLAEILVPTASCSKELHTL